MPKPSSKDASALASAAGGAPKPSEAAPAPAGAAPPVVAPRLRICQWTNESQFNLASWVAGKLRATLVAYDIPDIGKCELTFRELSGQENREIDAMVAEAATERTIFSEGDVMRFRNVAILAGSLVAINGKAWPEIPKTDKEAEPKRRQVSVADRTELIRSQTNQTMLDIYVRTVADFQEELLQLVRVIDPKLFASPSGSSAESSPSKA